MSDNKKEKNDSKRIKRIIYIIIAGLVVIASLVFVLWCLEIFTFGSKVDTKTVAPNGPGGMVGPPKNNPKKETFYDFEVNDGIKDRKASIAYHKLKSLTEAEKKKLEPEVYNRIGANQRKYAVKFTNTENIGIIRVLPVLLLNDIDFLNKICDVKLTDEQNKEPSVFNLCIELACHLKMREENGNISLLEYNKYLYTLDWIAEKKDELERIDNLNWKAREEANLLRQLNAAFTINRQTYSISSLLLASESIDKILPPKNWNK